MLRLSRISGEAERSLCSVPDPTEGGNVIGGSHRLRYLNSSESDTGTDPPTGTKRKMSCGFRRYFCKSHAYTGLPWRWMSVWQFESNLVGDAEMETSVGYFVSYSVKIIANYWRGGRFGSQRRQPCYIPCFFLHYDQRSPLEAVLCILPPLRRLGR